VAFCRRVSASPPYRLWEVIPEVGAASLSRAEVLVISLGPGPVRQLVGVVPHAAAHGRHRPSG
jgi:hypothetical protein